MKELESDEVRAIREHSMAWWKRHNTRKFNKAYRKLPMNHPAKN